MNTEPDVRRTDQLPERPPPSSPVGLLEHITAHAVDEDYAFVSARRQAAVIAGQVPRPRRRIGLLGALALAVFAVLVVTAAAQTARNAAGDARERDDLVSQVSSARRELDTDRRNQASLARATRALQTRQLSGDAQASGLLAQLNRLGRLTGARAVRGPGVRVVADDAAGAASARSQVLDTDLQKLANGFWEAGAEAISLNGQRLSTLSSIRTAGGAITVNTRSLRPPYVMQVVGNRDTLPARFAETSSGQAWLALQRQVGLQLTITPQESLQLPATAVLLRFASVPASKGAR